MGPFAVLGEPGGAGLTTLLLSVGIVVGLVFYELTGLIPGGIIVPGYIALYVDQPLRIVTTLAVSLATWMIGRFLFRWIIAYGRRRFGLFLLIGLGLKVLADYLLFNVAQVPWGLQSIGLIIPGIIANEMERQGIVRTIVSLGIVSLILYLIRLFIFSGATL